MEKIGTEWKNSFVIVYPDGLGKSVEIQPGPELFHKLYPILDCDLIEIVRSSILDAGSDSRLVLLVDESRALKADRTFNAYASSICGTPIYGTVAIGQEVDGEDGGEIVGLDWTDKARAMCAIMAIRTLMIRLPSNFIQSFIATLTLAFASTVPVTIDAHAFNEKIRSLVFDEYDAILENLKKEAGKNGTTEKAE